MKKIFFVQLWNTSRLLAVIIGLLCILQGYFMLKRIHNFPFFVYDMYSRPVPEPVEVKIPVLYINGKLSDYTKFPNWKEGAIVQLFKLYVTAEKQPTVAAKAFNRRFGNKFPSIYHRIAPSEQDVQRFPEWMAQFISRCTGEEVNSYRMGFRTYPVRDRQILPANYEEDILLDWLP